MRVQEIWPQGVGYDVQSGYATQSLSLKEMSFEKIQAIVQSWQLTARSHGFNCQQVSSLNILPGHESPSDVIIQYKSADPAGQIQELFAEMHAVEVSADVDEVPEDTFISLIFKGLNRKSNLDFKLSFIVSRYPQVNVVQFYNEIIT